MCLKYVPKIHLWKQKQDSVCTLLTYSNIYTNIIITTTSVTHIFTKVRITLFSNINKVSSVFDRAMK